MSSTLVTPFQIAVPMSDHLTSPAAVLPASNRLFSQLPAVSRIDWMPSWMAVPSLNQFTSFAAVKPAVKMFLSHSPAASSAPVTPERIDVPSAVQS